MPQLDATALVPTSIQVWCERALTKVNGERMVNEKGRKKTWSVTGCAYNKLPLSTAATTTTLVNNSC